MALEIIYHVCKVNSGLTNGTIQRTFKDCELMKTKLMLNSRLETMPLLLFNKSVSHICKN